MKPETVKVRISGSDKDGWEWEVIRGDKVEGAKADNFVHAQAEAFAVMMREEQNA